MISRRKSLRLNRTADLEKSCHESFSGGGIPVLHETTNIPSSPQIREVKKAGRGRKTRVLDKTVELETSQNEMTVLHETTNIPSSTQLLEVKKKAGRGRKSRALNEIADLETNQSDCAILCEESVHLEEEPVLEVKKPGRGRKSRVLDKTVELETSQNETSLSQSALIPLVEKTALHEAMNIPLTGGSSEFLEAKKTLHASMPERLICRKNEHEDLKSNLEACFNEKRAMSIYVNGPPGTGKTVSVTHILDSLKGQYKFKQIYINCMTIKNIQNLYKSILVDFNDSGTPSKRSSAKENLAKTTELKITTEKNPIILVLDEIDQIETSIKSTTDLYKIFEWPYLDNSKLILIGIANSLDFTDRLLPRLQLKPNNQPKLINFVPYSRNDIIEIVKDRLKDVQLENGAKCIIDDRALFWCASKIASSSGDIRKMLDICRRAIEILEKETKSSENASDVKTVGLTHMMKIFNDINPMNNTNFDRNSMPLLHKILLCTILMCNKESKAKETALSKLYDKFNKICKKYLTVIDSEAEFFNLCNLVQDSGLLTLKKAKDLRNSKISLKIDEQDLISTLQDEAMLADILTNKTYFN